MQNSQSNACVRIYKVGAESKIYGNTPGVCRITGNESNGIPFNDWVRKTFTDHASLLPGTIISNEALFCFDEASDIVMKRAGKEKPQRFRTYSHIIDADGVWHCCTKSDKRIIFKMIIDGASLVCLTDSGQKHVLFKHRPGMWQLDDMFIKPDIPRFIDLHTRMCALLDLSFSQTEVITGQYLQYRIMQVGIKAWKEIEDILKPYRGTKFFNFTAWLLFTNK